VVIVRAERPDDEPGGDQRQAGGERHPDRLVWREDDSGVDCLSCGTFYDPNSDNPTIVHRPK